MGSEWLINELRDAFDRLDEIERELAERNPKELRVKKSNGEVSYYDADKISVAISKAFQAVEGQDSNYLVSPYIAVRYIKCIALLKSKEVKRSQQFNVVLRIIFRLRLFVFTSLTIERIFQFLEPRLFHTSFSKGL